MELRHLRYFVVVAEEMNIHRAAKRLNISQPPLSVTIQQLEEELDASLFKREGRSIKITRAGENFYNRAKEILKNVEDVSNETKQINDGKTGKLKIGFISSAVTGVLQELVSAHRKHYPDIVLDIQQFGGANIIDGITQGALDVGIERLPVYLPEGVNKENIVKEGWCVAIPKNHPLSKKKHVHVTDLRDENLIFYPRWNSPASYDDVMALFAKNDVVPNIVQEAPEQMTIAGLVAAGMGIGIVPECMSRLPIKNIVHKPLAGTKSKTGFSLIYKNSADILIEQFLDLAKTVKF